MKISEHDLGVPWRSIFIYIVLAFGLLWIPFFGVAFATSQRDDPGWWQILLGIMGPYSPLVAAVLTRTLVAREGFRDAHLSFLVHWRFWLIALLLPFFWNSVQDALQVSLGFFQVNWAELGKWLYRVPINLFGGLIVFIGEEFGWRSYLLEKLRPLGRRLALLFSASIWAVWHLPLLLIPNANYGKQLDLLGALAALLVILLLGFIFGWLYLESNSVWTCVLMHSYNNLIALKLFSEAFTVKSEPTLLQSSLMAVVPIAFVWLVLYLKGGFTNQSSRAPISA